MSDVKWLGQRISYKRTDEELTVIITQQVSRLNTLLMMGWVAAWLAIGVVVSVFWMNTEAESDRLFFSIFMAFWAYFFVRVIKVLAWRLIGKEMIRVFDHQMTIKNAYGTYGKARFFDTENIKKLGPINYDETKFFQFMERAPWIIGAETIGFEYLRNRVTFGKQLESKEALQLARIVDKAIKEIPARAQRKKS
ncbi:MAG: hypothetical protein RL226_348 [Bacteroidota bacterium]|jgi:hypothetical protein